MRLVRQFHLYLGTLFAPAIIFFAFSGALQTLDLHKAKGGQPPPGWVAVMAEMHKNQRLARPRDPRAGAAPMAAKSARHAPADAAPPKAAAHLPLKIFVVVMAIGLIASAGLGVYIALRNRATRGVALLMLAIGAAAPVALLFV